MIDINIYKESLIFMTHIQYISLMHHLSNKEVPLMVEQCMI